MRKPDWIDKPPSEWPPEARIAFGILAEIAEIRLVEAATKAQEAKGSAEHGAA